MRALRREADRRQALGHYAIAHELRAAASDVERAKAYLESSRTVREP